MYRQNRNQVNESLLSGKITKKTIKMSSDVDDEHVLPDSLQKLEIVPVCSRLNLSHIPKYKDLQCQNPFSIASSSNDFDERVSKFNEK